MRASLLALAKSIYYQAMQTQERPLSENEIDDFLTKNERKERNAMQNILLQESYHLFWGVSAKKEAGVLYPETVPQIGQSLPESQQGRKLVKNFKIFWMNNKRLLILAFPWCEEVSTFAFTFGG